MASVLLARSDVQARTLVLPGQGRRMYGLLRITLLTVSLAIGIAIALAVAMRPAPGPKLREAAFAKAGETKPGGVVQAQPAAVPIPAAPVKAPAESRQAPMAEPAPAIAPYRDPVARQMPILAHHPQDLPKLLEVRALLRLQLVLLEERDDALEQMLLAAHTVGQPVAVILANHSATEESLQRMQRLGIALVLDHGELR